MTPHGLLGELRRRGIELVAAGDRLRFRPVAAVPPELLGNLRLHKEALLALLSAEASDTITRLLAMPLARFEREGALLEIRVPWLRVSLWFVPGEADAEVLAREGINRGRIWTARELMDLLAISGLTAEQPRTLARAKLEFGGEVVEVRPRRHGDPERGGEPA